MRILFELLFLCLALTYIFQTNNHIKHSVAECYRIYEKVHDNFLIDATVVSFPRNCNVTIYTATPRRLTQAQACDLLLANGDDISKWSEVYDPKRFYGYTANTALDGFLGHSVSKSRMYPSSFIYSNCLSTRWNNSQIYFGQQHFDDSAPYTFTTLFTKPKDFSFATAEEAERKVREQLTSLGFAELILHRILYIDHEILANEVTPVLRTEDWQELGYLPTYDNWSQADDGYIFEFFTGVDGIPMCYRNGLGKNAVYTGGTVQVWYQVSGIVYLHADASLWNLGKPLKSISRLIPVTVALNIAHVFAYAAAERQPDQ